MSSKSEEAPKSKKYKPSSKPKKKHIQQASATEEPKIRNESLALKRLVAGTVVLAQISRISNLELVVSLPNSILGYVPITNISKTFSAALEQAAGSDEESEDDDEENIPKLSECFKVGQWLRALIVSTTTDEGKKRLELSIDPQQVNESIDEADIVPGIAIQAAVTSVEDHGLVMDFAHPKISGFISKKELSFVNVDGAAAVPGQVLLLTIISKSSNGRTVTLTGSSLHKKVPTLEAVKSIKSVTAGVLVEGEIIDVRGSGIIIRLYEHLTGTIDRFHSGHNDSAESLTTFYKEGDSIKARVISTLPHLDDNQVALSVLPHVMGMTFGNLDAAQALPVGFIIENAKVLSVNSNLGVFLDIGVEKTIGFAHRNRLSDEPIDILTDSGKYKVDSVHHARVLGYSYADNMYTLSLEESVLKKQYLSARDIPVGDIINVTVSSILPKGDLIVNITDDLKGIVPALQISDVILANPERKFKIGSTTKARVLSVDTERNRIKLTLKKTLLNTTEPLLTSYLDAEPGFKTVATVVSLMPSGALLEFFGGVHGFVRKSEITEAYIKDPKDYLRLGQTVSVRVLTCQPEEGRLSASCRVGTESSEARDQFDQLEGGKSVVTAVVVEKTKESIIVEIEPSKVRGILRAGQLSDEDEDKKNAAFKKIQVSKVIDNLLVLEKNSDKNSVYLTAKPSLIAAANAGTLPGSIEEVHPNQQLQGFVANVTNAGVFVTFANRLTSLAFKTELFRDRVVEDPTRFFKPFQSITCTVTSVDADAGRFNISLKTHGNQQVGKTVLNPVDKAIKSLTDFKVGRVTKGRVKKVTETQLNIDLADNQQGRLDISEVFDSWDDIEDKKRPLSKFKKGDVINVKIIGQYNARTHKYLAITQSSTGLSSVLELSSKPSDLTQTSKPAALSIDDVEIGSQWTAFINNSTWDALYASVTPEVTGRIPLVNLSDDLSLLEDHDNLYPVGSAVQVTVVGKDTVNDKPLLQFSARRDQSAIEKYDPELEGEIVVGQVFKVTPLWVYVRIGSAILANVSITELADKFTEGAAMVTQFKSGQFLKVKIVKVDKPNKKVFGSLRPSLVYEEENEHKVIDKHINDSSDVHVGEIVRGFVSNVANSGLFVSLGHDIIGRVMIKNITDGFIDDWKSKFTVQQLVKARVLSVDGDKVNLSLKESHVSGGAGSLKVGQGAFKDFSQLQVGDVMTGHVRKIEEYGVFISLHGTDSIDGLCHRSQISDSSLPIKDISKVFSIGDKVKAKILSIDTEKRRLSLGLKASYFEDEDSDEDMEDADSEDEEMEEADDQFDSDKDSDSDWAGLSTRNADSDSESEDEADSDSEEEPDAASFAGLASGTGLSAGFDWTTSVLDQPMDAADSDESSDEEGSDDTADQRKKNKKNKRKNKVVEDKTAELSTKAPESAADFERLLVGSPNSSVVWMSFMAFQLQLSEIDKAREIAERALKTISFREEEEKLNVWVALLNLENSFGTEESLEDAFKRAVQFMDSLTVYEKMGKIYSMSGKVDKAIQVYENMCKKFASENPAVYETYGQMLYEQANKIGASTKQTDLLVKARGVLDKALRLMSNNPGPANNKKAQAELVSKFARFEFTLGDIERGRTLFEGLISSYPKRVDLWSIYIDQEVKCSKEREAVEKLFERVLKIDRSTSHINMKQAKFFFKKWLAYEDAHGDSKALDYVKAKAAEYVSSRSKKEAADEEEDEE